MKRNSGFTLAEVLITINSNKYVNKCNRKS
ncbi:prepilin-type N-terminal cleavage/methylation domain-containing protein [bacterium]|nr:prepilin-type N-terminal cleavage/methylation domain-containing protein [bacterium]